MSENVDDSLKRFNDLTQWYTVKGAPLGSCGVTGGSSGVRWDPVGTTLGSIRGSERKRRRFSEKLNDLTQRYTVKGIALGPGGVTGGSSGVRWGPMGTTLGSTSGTERKRRRF